MERMRTKSCGIRKTLRAFIIWSHFVVRIRRTIKDTDDATLNIKVIADIIPCLVIIRPKNERSGSPGVMKTAGMAISPAKKGINNHTLLTKGIIPMDEAAARMTEKTENEKRMEISFTMLTVRIKNKISMSFDFGSIH